MGVKQQQEIIRLERALDRACARVIELRIELLDREEGEDS